MMNRNDRAVGPIPADHAGRRISSSSNRGESDSRSGRLRTSRCSNTPPTANHAPAVSPANTATMITNCSRPAHDTDGEAYPSRPPTRSLAGRVRWVVERTMAWLPGFRRLALRYDRTQITTCALLSSAAALICHRRLR